MNALIRTARRGDIRAIAELVGYYARQDELLPRSEEEIRDSLDQWLVSELDGELAAVGSLVPYSDVLVELRSLAVAPDRHGRGLGGQLVEALAEKATDQGYRELFALTRAVQFFAHCGFAVVGMERFPQKVWTDCARCPLRDHCDETPMVRYLRPGRDPEPEFEIIDTGASNGNEPS